VKADKPPESRAIGRTPQDRLAAFALHLLARWDEGVRPRLWTTQEARHFGLIVGEKSALADDIRRLVLGTEG
jgi:hypothetical protein